MASVPSLSAGRLLLRATGGQTPPTSWPSTPARFRISAYRPPVRAGSPTATIVPNTIGPTPLPEKYVVIQPYSANARKVYRDVNTDEWQAILAWLTRIGMQGVVLNKGGEEAIASRKLIDLSNRTTLYQAIRIVNGAVPRPAK